MAVNKVRVKVSGSIGKSVRVGGTSTTTTGGLTSAQVAQQIASAVAAIPAASGGSGTVTSVGITAGSADITVTGVSPITGSGSLAIDLSAGIKATVASALQTAGSTHLVVTGTAIDLAAADKADIALAATAVQPGAIQNMESALWNSTSGPVLLSLTVPQDILIPYNCTLREVDILTQGGTGNCTITILRAQSSAGAIANLPPAVDITNGNSPQITGGTLYTNTTFTGWTTTTLTQNDVLRLTLTANTAFTSVKIILRMY